MFCDNCGMFLLKGNAKRHFDRLHRGRARLLRVEKRPKYPLYENFQEFMKDPFNVVPHLMPPAKECGSPDDTKDLQAGILQHTTGYDDSFIPEDYLSTREESEISKAHSLMPPRRKLNSSLQSGNLRKRRQKVERVGTLGDRTGRALAKNFYTAKLYYRRRFHKERKRAFGLDVKHKAAQRKVAELSQQTARRGMMVQASQRKHQFDGDHISQLSSKVDELESVKRSSLPITTHRQLMQEQENIHLRSGMDCEERDDLKNTIQGLETEVQRLKNSMTFGGIIADPLKNTVEYHGQYLLPEQIADIEKNDKILHLENKLEELKRDKQFLEQQAELNDIEDPQPGLDEAAKEILIAEVEELRMGRAELQLESDTKTTQLARTTALIRTQQARIHELNRRLGIAQ